MVKQSIHTLTHYPSRSSLSTSRVRAAAHNATTATVWLSPQLADTACTAEVTSTRYRFEHKSRANRWNTLFWPLSSSRLLLLYMTAMMWWDCKCWDTQFEYSCRTTLLYFAVIESGNFLACLGILISINICQLWTHISIFRFLFDTNKSTRVHMHIRKVASRTFFYQQSDKN